MRIFDSLINLLRGSASSRENAVDAQAPAGDTVTTEARSDVGVAPDLAQFYGERVPWELPVQYGAADCIRAGDTVLDIGGHLGAVAIAFSRLTGPNGRVFTFEPNREMWPHLLKNLQINNAANVSHIPLACFAETGRLMTFYSEPSFYKAGSGLMRNIEGAQKFHVVTISIDDFCSKNNISPSFIKIDVEGAEIHVLRSMSKLLEQGKPSVIIEYQCTEKPGENDPLVFLRSKGYIFFDINTYQQVSPEAYSKVPGLPLANVFCAYQESAVAKRYSGLSLETVFDSGELSPPVEKVSEIALSSGRYIVHLEFACPDHVIAGLAIESGSDYLAYYEDESEHLRHHSCSYMVLDLSKDTAIVPGIVKKGEYEAGLTRIRVHKVRFMDEV